MSRAGLEKHIQAGRFQMLPDGSVDRPSFDVWLQRRPPVAPATPPPATESGERSASDDERVAALLVDQDGVFATKADAERFRDSFIGRLRQVEYDRESRTVADVKDTAQLVGQEYARVRTKMLAIPAERAPQLFRCKTVAEMQDMLRDVIGRALEELTADDPGAVA